KISAVHDFLFLYQAQNPVEMLFIDNFSVIRVAKWLFPVLLLDLLLHFFDQLVFDSDVAVNIVWCNAGLSAVEVFSKDNSFCCQFYISSLIHNTWTFPAQL